MNYKKLTGCIGFVLLAQFGFAQIFNFAGEDKTICKGSSIMIGTGGSGDFCYKWSPEDGLDDPTSPTPIASPMSTTKYTLVTQIDFSLRQEDEITITVVPVTDCCPMNSKVTPTSDPTTKEEQYMPNVNQSSTTVPDDLEVNWKPCLNEIEQKWYARVTALNCTGTIKIIIWPSEPEVMDTPNTPNPVVGGNINNTAGSENYWSFAMDDLADYDFVGGGAGPHWHSTDATIAHENYHWYIDWMIISIGANWPPAEVSIENLCIPTSTHATSEVAKTALDPQVETHCHMFDEMATDVWNNTIDLPGLGGGGYAAGGAILDTYIDAIEAFRLAQEWE